MKERLPENKKLYLEILKYDAQIKTQWQGAGNVAQ